MSNVPPAGLLGVVLDNSYALIMNSTRMIGTIIPDVGISEQHEDELRITDHPVESGAIISDHAFMLPVSVEMRCGWSNSTAGMEGYVQEVYQELLALQESRQPFDVYTGKRAYTSMLLQSLAVTTDRTSEFALMVVANLRQVIIVDTNATSLNAANQAQPQQTAPVQNGGTKALIPNAYPDLASVKFS